MVQKLPTKLLQVIKDPHLDRLDGFLNAGVYNVLDVDLDYPKEIHDKTRDFPFCPVHFSVAQSSRLMCCQYDLKNYLVSAHLLAYYLNGGMVIKKINAVYTFKAGYPFKNYVNDNIAQRKVAKAAGDSVMTNFFKIKNNSLYGKTMENVFKYRKMSLIGPNTSEDYPLQDCLNWTVLDDDDQAYLVELPVSEVTLDKCPFIGFAVLDYAKRFMYEHWYENILGVLPEARLLYTDTDSFFFSSPVNIRTLDHDLAPWLDWNGTKTSGQLGFEYPKPIIEFIAIRAKTYALRFTEDQDDDRFKNKGIVRSAVNVTTNEPITFNDYRRCLIDNVSVKVSQHLLRSKKQKMTNINQIKLALFNNDEKRFAIDYRRTLPWGYDGEIKSQEYEQFWKNVLNEFENDDDFDFLQAMP
jgi:hypothetical protein